MRNELTFDVVVIGGGHAGWRCYVNKVRCKYCFVLLLIPSERCLQSSYWRIGEGHLVREIDALDGLMGEVADNQEYNLDY